MTFFSVSIINLVYCFNVGLKSMHAQEKFGIDSGTNLYNLNKTVIYINLRQMILRMRSSFYRITWFTCRKHPSYKRR
jgi:hypothetical protein